MKFKKISTRMLATILPVIIIATSLLTLISAISSRNIIEEQISGHMSSELTAQESGINNRLGTVSDAARTLANVISASYKTTDMSVYESMLGKIVQSNDIVLGSGIWFEPYAFDSSKEYMGPYVVKDGDKVSTTYDYSNKDYDYFSQEYYLNAKQATDAVFTDPYYDSTSGLVMSSCSMPFFDESGKFLGCVTVDMKLDTIQELVESIKVGKKGNAMLIGSNGTYIYSADEPEASSEELKFTEDENASLASAAKIIMAGQSGMTRYKKGSAVYNLYYTTIEGLGWKLVIQLPESEVNEPVSQLLSKLLIVCLIALVCAALVVLWQIRKISKNLNSVKDFAVSLASGDFTVEMIPVKSEDELGKMSTSLNSMYGNNRDIIREIAGSAGELNTSSKKLYASSEELSEEFEKIEKYMTEVNEAMMSASAATEEVNASTEEVNSSVGILSGETDRSSKMSEEISERVTKVRAATEASYNNAIELSNKFENEVKESIENAKVVSKIGTMASTISEIASQINLLSLNASIEAARAGEQGKGFAVVASEIGKLASETATAVENIQDTVGEVKVAFDELLEDSKSFLEFLKETVTPDYQKFLGVANQYGEDANSISDISGKIAEMTEGIERIMGEVSIAIQNIAESSQSTADNSSRIMESVSDVSKVVGNVSDMSKNQENIADGMENVVSKFKLE